MSSCRPPRFTPRNEHCRAQGFCLEGGADGKLLDVFPIPVARIDCCGTQNDDETKDDSFLGKYLHLLFPPLS